MMTLPLSPAADGADDASTQDAAILRGTRSGLEIVVNGNATVNQIGDALAARLEQSPGFFAGNDAAVRVEGHLPAGALARLEEVTARFELRITEVGPQRPPASQAEPPAGPASAAPDSPQAAEGSAPQGSAAAPDRELGLDDSLSIDVNMDADLAAAVAAPHEATQPGAGPRLLVGPIRSGVVLDAPADLVILGDVNPGAEIQARGNIIVLGRLRGIAHAAVGGERGFILALRLEPQQLRIGTLVARAGDADSPAEGAEIAYATGRTIVVERYQGRLPGGLSTAA